jgi:hypothetical protein
LAALPLPTLAQKFFKGEQELDIKIATVRTQELAYALGMLAVPVCTPKLLGPAIGSPFMAVYPESVASRREVSAALKKRYGAMESEAAVVVDHQITPYGEAGFKLGDIVSSESLQPRVPYEPKDTYGARRKEYYAGKPVETYTVRRGDQTLQLTVANTLSCSGGVMVLDSKGRFADSAQGWGIMVSYPLLSTLTAKEQAIVIAHELGEQISGANSFNGSTGSVVGAVLFGNLSRIGTNGDTRFRRPKPDDMLQADLVALWLLSLIGVSPAEYLDLLTRLDAEKSAFSDTDYATTRPLQIDRIKFLKEMIEQKESGQALPLPTAFTAESVEQLRAAADKSGLLPKIAAMLMPEPTVKP